MAQVPQEWAGNKAGNITKGLVTIIELVEAAHRFGLDES
jgi:hypothetical protein